MLKLNMHTQRETIGTGNRWISDLFWRVCTVAAQHRLPDSTFTVSSSAVLRVETFQAGSLLSQRTVHFGSVGVDCLPNLTVLLRSVVCCAVTHAELRRHKSAGKWNPLKKYIQ